MRNATLYPPMIKANSRHNRNSRLYELTMLGAALLYILLQA